MFPKFTLSFANENVNKGQTKYGAEDRSGNMIVPVEYDEIHYHAYYNYPELESSSGPGFTAGMGKYDSYYNRDGKCIIPYTRQYTIISKHTEVTFGTYYLCKPEQGGYHVCDVRGNIVVQSPTLCYIAPQSKNGRYYYHIESNMTDGKRGHGIMDMNGNIVIPPIHHGAFLNSDNVFEDYDHKEIADLEIINTTNNPFENNPIESPNVNSASSSSSSKNNSESGGTTTIVVEHQHTPQPMQEWQQCNICYGSGNCSICGGNGWNPYSYANGRYNRCISCGGNGRCSYCAGRGGKNIIVYR